MKLTVDQAIRKAHTLTLKGQDNEAEALYQDVLQRFPGNRRALEGLQALRGKRTAIVPDKDVQTLLDHYDKGRLTEVIDLASALARRFPDAPIIYNVAGAASADLGRFDMALAHYEKVLQLKSDDADAHANRGVVLRELKRLEEALASFEAALLLKPGSADAQYGVAVALQGMNRLGEANAAYEKAIQLNPDHAEAHYNRALALKGLRRLDEAIAGYDKALRLRPDHAEAHNNRGNALKALGRLEEALAGYDRAIEIRPDYAEAHSNRAVALHELKRFEEAVAACERAIQLRPDHAEAHNNRAISLEQLGRADESIASYGRAIELKPAYVDAYYNLGNALKELQRLDQAIARYDQALELKPDHAAAQSQKLHLKAKICDWTSAGHGVEPAGQGPDGNAVEPFTLLAGDDDPLRQFQRARAWAQEQFPSKAPAGFTPAVRHERIRVGYFSADFHDHATMYLMAGLFRRHDRRRFEIHAYSYGAVHGGEMREMLVRNTDSFTDIRDMPDPAAVALARRHGLDIAVDLKGYTQHGRAGLFAARLAPIQIGYLGYPGTMGASFIDYIIADTVVIPVDQQAHYAEKIIYLPHSYQVNDDQRVISGRVTSRTEQGLPQTGFVFCCFNNSYKITPAEFDIWMRLLHKVEGSVLWLLKANKWGEANLRNEARLRGVDPDRLIFAERMPQAEHLARQRHADLFLDTFNINAHTTASDALWAGLPVLTKAGKGFPARVAASLLHAIGLPELVTRAEADYEQLALVLATSPDRLSAIRSRLAKNRLTAPLFDTALTTGHIEAAYEAAYQRYRSGQIPDSISIMTK